MHHHINLFSIIICTFLLQIIHGSFSLLEYEGAFTKWMIKYNKSYSNEEFQFRFKVFQANMDYIQTYNAKNTGVVLGMNIFGDLTNEEFQQFYIGKPQNFFQ